MQKDQEARLKATDPTRSFIVQAPAGSGKTELLTQRYLRLLGCVAVPEQITALTFTRKAASEMRERILTALNQAQNGVTVTSAHQQITRQYAEDALARSKLLDWQILKQPTRLKIVTIDSLCQSLANAIPLQEHQTPFAEISDDPYSLYRQAVRDGLADMLDNAHMQHNITQLLEHLDNRQDTLLDLLCNLLSSREQWLTILFKAREQTKETYEQALEAIEQHELQRLCDSLPTELQDEMRFLAWQMGNLETDPTALRFSLRNWHEFHYLNRDIASALASLLLTSEQKFRKSFDHHVGLKRGCCEDSLYDNLKSKSKALLNALENHPDFLAALLRVKNLPSPHYEASQWQILQALLTILPRLAAHLQMVFSTSNEVDFTAISQQALLALGDEESPTDLTLYLDNAIHHLLVDEFQDTSMQQFELLTKLVSGWLPDDGKTLFVVGDPMQSIYRFRQAEVGLFLKARSQGIGSVRLIPLELCCNFRSSATLVSWVNSQFKNIFPKYDDMESGAISFHPSVNSALNDDNSGIYARYYADRQAEAEAILACAINEQHNHPNDSIAILVRSRNQLARIIPLLRAKNIPFQGVETEKLASLPHIQDIWSLTKALLEPANRLAWLAVLRSPWCGLTLADLLIIANVNRKKSIFFALSQLEKLPTLSQEGRLRAQYFYHVMHTALNNRHQQTLTEGIIDILQQLHSKELLDSAQRADLEQFFIVLSRFTKQGQLADSSRFELEFSKLYSARVTPSCLQIMTIHKSKGLEFDCVILPGLGSKAQPHDKPLLRWMRLPADQDELLLLSPIHASHQKKCPLYDYIGEFSRGKEWYEQQRLLYVAATRAKKRLYLFDGHEKPISGTFRELLASQAFEADMSNDIRVNSNDRMPTLSRLPQEFYTQPPTLALTKKTNATAILPVIATTRRLTGIIAHELLQWVCTHHPQHISELPWGMMKNRFRGLGFSAEEQSMAMKQLTGQMEAMFADPTGQWICSQHAEERNEYELLVHEHGQTVTKIIDRTFLDKGWRWIIDFKTGKDDAKTQSDHQDQVNEYARLLAMHGADPIRCGLYYLANNHWLSWEAINQYGKLPSHERSATQLSK